MTVVRGWRRAAALRATAAATLLAAAVAAPATAQQAANCDDPQTNSAMIKCADKDYRAADAALNAQWHKTLKIVEKANKETGGDADLVKKLRAAERAWIAFRDAECKLRAAQVYGGTMQPVVSITCQTELTQQRTKALAKLAQDFGPK